MFIGKKQIRLHIHGICLDFKVVHACSQAFQLKRASRSLAKTGFFDSERSQDDSMLDLVLGGVLEASWSDLGRFLGGQDAPKMAQDGAKTAQDGAKMAQDGAKMAQDGAKTLT